MTSQFDFSNAEWDDIAGLPVLVGLAVAKAEDSGFLGNIREIRTLVSSIGEQSSEIDARSLIAAVNTIDAKDKVDEYADHTPEVLADIAVRACAEVSKTLHAKATEHEAASYQAWVYGVAEQVANAAKEHGVRVSEPEAALLDRMYRALEQT